MAVGIPRCGALRLFGDNLGQQGRQDQENSRQLERCQRLRQLEQSVFQQASFCIDLRWRLGGDSENGRRCVKETRAYGCRFQEELDAAEA